MRHLLPSLLILISLVSLCANIPFISSGNSSVQEAGFMTIDQGSPDFFLSAQATPSEVKAGRDVYLSFQISNKNSYSLKDVSLNIYDPCIFTGQILTKSFAEIKPNITESFSLKLTAGSTDLDKVCNIKFRVTYDADVTLYQSIAVLTSSEYDQMEMAGTLGSVPIESSYPPSPLKVALTFSDAQPFIDKEAYYVTIDYYNVGSGLLDVQSGGIKIKVPTNMANFKCSSGDYSNNAINRALSFIDGRAPNSACSFTASATGPQDIKSLSIDSHYENAIDGAIPITVDRARVS